MSSGNIPLRNQPRINGKERFRQQRSENLLGEDDQAWYTSNNAYDYRAGWDMDAGRFAKISQFGAPSFNSPYTEHLVESEPPYFGESQPWYATRNPINLIEGAYDARTFIPTYRDALTAQGEYTATGMRELFTPKRSERLASEPAPLGRYICAGCNCSKCVASSKRGTKCTGCSCPNCHCHIKTLPKNKKHEHFMEIADDNSYTTDPRFLVGTADLHFNVGSDVNDITRVYGTVDQKRYYPKLADYINYGVASVLETPK
jgi:hypothetical protein